MGMVSRVHVFKIQGSGVVEKGRESLVNSERRRRLRVAFNNYASSNQDIAMSEHVRTCVFTELNREVRQKAR